MLLPIGFQIETYRFQVLFFPSVHVAGNWFERVGKVKKLLVLLPLSKQPCFDPTAMQNEK